VATVEFYQLLVEQVRLRNGTSPELVIHNVPMPLDLKLAVLAGSQNDADKRHIVRLLADALDALERADCHLIAMPCNSFHYYLRPLIADRSMTLVDIVDVTIEQAARRGIDRLLLLATGSSVDHDAYASARHRGIEVVSPADQMVVTRLLERCVGARAAAEDLEAVNVILAEEGRGTRGVLLGCTDLTVLKAPLTAVTQVVDSLTCLVEACAEVLA
jgi:aspartate racemase